MILDKISSKTNSSKKVNIFKIFLCFMAVLHDGAAFVARLPGYFRVPLRFIFTAHPILELEIDKFQLLELSKP